MLAQRLKDKATLIPAGSLSEARDRLAEGSFDLVILDLTLPDASGTEILDSLQPGRSRSTPVIVLSASETDEETRSKVEAALVKSRLSASKIVDMIVTHLS